MRVLIQRVTKGSVRVDGKVVSVVSHGFVLLLGVARGDYESDADMLAGKIVNMRIFNDQEDKFNRSLLEVDGGVLVVPQFTLFADVRKGRRPSFTDAAPLDAAAILFDYFVGKLHQLGVSSVSAGHFGAKMRVEIHNDGPVTLWLDSSVL